MISNTSSFQYPRPPVWEFVPDESLESPSAAMETGAAPASSVYVMQESAGCLDASWQEEEECGDEEDDDDDDVRTPFQKPFFLDHGGTTTTGTTGIDTDIVTDTNTDIHGWRTTCPTTTTTTPRKCWMLLLLLVVVAMMAVLVAVLWVVPAVSSSSSVSLTHSSQCVWDRLDDDGLVSTDDNQDNDDLAVYAHLQRLLGPLVLTNNIDIDNDNDGDGDGDDCFPATFQQQQALVWLMNHWLLPQDKLELQTLATPTTSDSNNNNNNNDDEDPSMQVEWLVQAFVASLLALHWDLHHHLPTSVSGSVGSSTSTSLPLHVETLCSWAGVLCTGDGRWRSLQWNSNSDTDYVQLQGSIPTELGLLTQLRLLDLSQQPDLTGSLPLSLTRLSHLQALYLQDNVALTGTFPSALAVTTSSNYYILWPELTDVRIRHCPGIQQHGLTFLPTIMAGGDSSIADASSSISVTVSPQLQFLEWSQTLVTTTTETGETDDTVSSSQEVVQDYEDPSMAMFSSTLPPELGLWTNLQWVILDGNGWVGTIPSTLNQWSKVQMLDLAYNYLEGTMPTELGQWTTLEWLSLQDSGLTGKLPSPWVDLDWSYLEVGNTGTFGGLDLEPESIYSLMQHLSIDCKCGEEWPLMIDNEGSVAPLPEKCFCSKTLDG